MSKKQIHFALQLVSTLLLTYSVIMSGLKVFIISLGVQIIWWAGMGHPEINGVETIFGNSILLVSSILALCLIWWHPK